jgi:hypothetical protein
VYALGTNDDLFVGHDTPGAGWFDSGLKVRQISAGADAVGNPEVHAIGFNNQVYDRSGSGGPAGFADWGGYATQISATVDATVYAIGPDDAVYEDHGSGGGTGWVSLGGYAKQINAGIDASGRPEVFAIGLNDGLWSNHGTDWTSLGNNYVLEIAAPAVNIGLGGDLVYAVAQGQGALLHNGTSFSSISGGTIE